MSKVFIRSSISGDEYWCAEEKRILFVPQGQKPRFDSETNEQQEETNDETAVDLDEMNVDELLAYAKHADINVPGTMRKEETIRNFIIEQQDTVHDDE